MILQALLIVSTLGIAGLVLRPGSGHRQLALRRLAGAFLALGGVVAVLWPAAVTWVAQLVGVGRGTDLLLYVMVMFFLFTTASLYQRVQALQSQMTTLVRELALRHPQSPAGVPTTPPDEAQQPEAAVISGGEST